MKHQNYQDVKEEPVDMEGAKDVTIRWLIGEKDEALNFAMRIFTVQPGGHTPYHHHAFEHEVFIVKGNGNLKKEDGMEPLKQGDFVFVKPDEWHQFRNDSKQVMQFMCLIPIEKK